MGRGEDVTANARRIPNIPESIDWDGDAHVRGEVVMPLDVFREKYASIALILEISPLEAFVRKPQMLVGDAADLAFHAYGVMFPSAENRHPDSPFYPAFTNDSEAIDWLESNQITAAGNEVVEGECDEAVTKAIIEVTKRWTQNRDNVTMGGRRGSRQIGRFSKRERTSW